MKSTAKSKKKQASKQAVCLSISMGLICLIRSGFLCWPWF